MDCSSRDDAGNTVRKIAYWEENRHSRKFLSSDLLNLQSLIYFTSEFDAKRELVTC